MNPHKGALVAKTEQLLDELGDSATAVAERLIDLDAIRERAQAAIRGPWRASLIDAVDLGDGEINGRGALYPEPRGSAPIFVTNSVTKMDLDFMAAARTDVPKLLAEVERLAAILDEIRLLHTDSPAGVCPSCGRISDVSDDDDGLVGWPCPTLRAMGIEVGPS